MKNPVAENAPGATLALLMSRKFVFCDLYTMTLPSGQQYRYSTGDVDVGYNIPPYGMVSWTSRSLRFDTSSNKAQAHWATGLNVDTWKFEAFPRPTELATSGTGPNANSYFETIMAYGLFGAVTTAAQTQMAIQPTVNGFAIWALANSTLATVVDPTTYVTDLFERILKRPPDTLGLASWVNALNTGASREYVLIGFASSGEALNHYYGDIIWTEPFLTACAGGILDGAYVTIDRAYFSIWPSNPWPTAFNPAIPTGVLPLFSGRIGEIDVGRTSAVITINSHLELLTQQMPRNLFQSGCVHTLFDTGCTLNRFNFSTWGTVGPASSTSVIYSSAPGPGGSHTYNLGQLYMSSGQNAGTSRAIRAWVYAPGLQTNAFLLLSPFNFPIGVGETFLASAGCDKSLGHCLAFGNSINFGGTPFVPTPETAF